MNKSGVCVYPVQYKVDKEARARLKSQRPCVLWMTGLSAAGKSTIADILECRLHAAGRHTYLIDGDNIRLGINRDLDFSTAHRTENIRRAAEIARLMVDAGLIVIAALISPFRADRQLARRLFEPCEFVEIHVHASLQDAEARDPKGLYRQARLGHIDGFTGIDSPYEAPDQAEIVIDTASISPEAAAVHIIDWLVERGHHSVR